MRVGVGAAVVGTALFGLLGAAAPAAATQGSVPIEVAEFATAPDGLVQGLDDFFGPGPDGEGIDFDETTEIGSVDRVFSFTPEWLAGGAEDAPVRLANEWAVPVAVGGEPVGVAVIWINPATVTPQLADFVPDPAFAESLAAVAADAFLVEDRERGAWFSLEPPTLTALVSGNSGVAAQTALQAYQKAVSKPVEAPTVEEGPDLGAALSVGTIVAVSLTVVLVLLIPAVRRRRAGVETEPDGEPEPEAEPEAEPELEADEK